MWKNCIVNVERTMVDVSEYSYQKQSDRFFSGTESRPCFLQNSSS